MNKETVESSIMNLSRTKRVKSLILVLRFLRSYDIAPPQLHTVDGEINHHSIRAMGKSISKLYDLEELRFDFMCTNFTE